MSEPAPGSASSAGGPGDAPADDRAEVPAAGAGSEVSAAGAGSEVSAAGAGSDVRATDARLDAAPGDPAQPPSGGQADARTARRKSALRVLLFLAAAAGVGALAGVIWWQVVDLPVYTVAADGGASTTERGLTQYVAGDAWYSLIGFVVGIGLGVLGWRVFRRLGWVVVPLVIVGSVISALICWWVGWNLGPGPFPPRLAEAQAGAVVPIELTVRARAAVLVWPFGAVLVTLLGSALGRDEEEPRPIFAKPIFAKRRLDSDSHA